MNQDKEKLRNYRDQLKKIKPRLMSQAVYCNTRKFIPTTFDTMMTDFGKSVERQGLY